MRYLLPLYLVAYFIAAFFWRSFVVWKRTGVNPVVFKGSDNAHDFIGRVFKVLFAVIVAIVVVYAFIPSAYQFVMPIHSLERPGIQLTGFIVLLVSFVWTIVAQAQMGNSWRIGIDNEHSTALVHTGVFRLSRNPIFVGIIMTLVGFFLVIPSAGTFITLLLGVILIGIQVRLEEEYLTRMHGEKYLEYRSSVRRWI